MTSESSSSVGGEKVLAGTSSGRLLGRYVVTRGVVTSIGGGGAACGSWPLALPGGGESRQVLAQPSKLGTFIYSVSL